MTNTLKQHVQNLHLSGLLNSLELRLQEAEANRLPYAQFLELLLQDEINVRDQRILARRRKSADFREPRSLENFDFSFNPSINRAQIYELATSHFVRQHRDVLLAQVSQFLTKKEKVKDFWRLIPGTYEREVQLEACGTTYPVFSGC